jgi:hypothetical protein
LEDLSVDGKILLIMDRENLDWIHLAQDMEKGGPAEHGNETYDSIKGGELID